MSSTWGESIIKFDEVTYSHVKNRPILEEVSFSVRKGAKITLMGQNGAGKSTIFKLITGELKIDEGDIHIQKDFQLLSQSRLSLVISLH